MASDESGRRDHVPQDSGTAFVYALRFDGSTGAVSDRRTLMQIDQPGVAPDGLTVDEQGGLWVALWGGAAVNRYRPDGTLQASVELPLERPASRAFGGPDRAALFVTTAPLTSTAPLSRDKPEAGRVFAIEGLGVRGFPCLPYRGRTPRPSAAWGCRGAGQPRGRERYAAVVPASR